MLSICRQIWNGRNIFPCRANVHYDPVIEEQAVKSPAILIPSPFSSRIHSFSSCTVLSLQCNSFCSNVIRITLPGITQLLPFPTSGDILNEVTIYLTCFLSSPCSEIFSCNSLNLSPRKDHSARWMIPLKSCRQSPAPLFSTQIKFENSSFVVSVGLGFPAGFHCSGLIPDQIILFCFCVCASSEVFQFSYWALYSLLFFRFQEFPNALWDTKEK